MHWQHQLVWKDDGAELFPQTLLCFPLYPAFRGKDVSYFNIRE
jgi:hypothetical protein